MEDSKSGGTSDRDKKMMGNFEQFGEDDEEDEKKDKKRKRPSFSSLFELATDDKSEKSDDQDKDGEKTPSVTESWFRSDSEPEAETEEADGDTRKEKDAKQTDVAQEPNEGADQSPESGEVAEAGTENLDDEEIRAAIDHYVEQRLPEAETEEEQTLLKNVQTAGSVEEGFQATVEELGLEEELETDEADQPDAEIEDILDEDVETEDDEPEQTTSTTTPTTSTTTSSTFMPPTPPVPPQPPTQPPVQPPYATPMPPLGPPGNPNNLPINPNTVAVPSQPETGRKYQRGADLLVGGMVGYLFGRRRGRINAEAKLYPIQRSLEKQVGKLYGDIEEKEATIRRLAIAKAEAEHKVTEIEESDKRRAFEAPIRTNFQHLESERLGRIVVPPIELASEKASESNTMSTQELLGVAANIRREGVSVREMYEQGRLDAVGLRLVVQEYMAGRPIERSLEQHLKDHETERVERDPFATGNQGVAAAAGGAYGSTGFDEATPVPSAAPLQQINPDHQYSHPVQQSYADQQRRQAVAVGVITGLMVAVVVLILLFFLS